MARYESVEEMLRPALASRTGTDSDRDIYPWVLAAAAVAAVRIAVTRWGRSGADREELVSLLQIFFRAPAAGTGNATTRAAGAQTVHTQQRR